MSEPKAPKIPSSNEQFTEAAIRERYRIEGADEPSENPEDGNLEEIEKGFQRK